MAQTPQEDLCLNRYRRNVVIIALTYITIELVARSKLVQVIIRASLRFTKTRIAKQRSKLLQICLDRKYSNGYRYATAK